MQTSEKVASNVISPTAPSQVKEMSHIGNSNYNMMLEAQIHEQNILTL